MNTDSNNFVNDARLELYKKYLFSQRFFNRKYPLIAGNINNNVIDKEFEAIIDHIYDTSTKQYEFNEINLEGIDFNNAVIIHM